ncbi:MAG: ZIP family metal transporter [Marinirhabdus sp.]
MQYILLLLAVLLGYIAAWLLHRRNIARIPIFLAFSGAFLLALTFFELMPGVYQLPSRWTGVFIVCGILLQILLEFLSKGAEHGHVHASKKEAAFPWPLFLSLCLHALVEGFSVSGENNMAVGIFMHKVPVTIILTFFFIQHKVKKGTVFFFLFVFALMAPLGAYLMGYVPLFAMYRTQLFQQKNH